MTNISHELRTPLALIGGPLEKLKRSNDIPQTSKKSLDLALSNTRRLHELVDQILDYRQVNNGKIKLELKQKDLVSFLNLTVRNFENLANSRQQTVALTCDREHYYCEFDVDAMTKILDNLVVNALKYSPDGTAIKIVATLPSPKWHQNEKSRQVPMLSVEDQGVGITKEQQKHIFDPFYTGKQTLSTNLSSFGIGLSLVKELVTLHQGQIEVQSPICIRNNQNVGTRFSLTFPELLPISRSEIAEDELNSPVAATPANESNENDIVVLVVDDHKEWLDFITEELSEEFKVISALSGDQGLAMAKQHVPDAIISDVMMPNGMDGIELCQKLKQDISTSHIPVILQTSLSSASSQEAGLKMGAIDYISKPVSISVLVNKIKNYLASREVIAKSTINHLSPGDKQSNSEVASDNVLEPFEQRFIDKLNAIIEDKFSEPSFNAESLAYDMNMSRSAFYRKFKAIANQSPAEYIKDYRLDVAVKLLVQENFVINNIPENIGYAELSPFYRAFKKKFGCTPSEYRKQALEKKNGH